MNTITTLKDYPFIITAIRAMSFDNGLSRFKIDADYPVEDTELFTRASAAAAAMFTKTVEDEDRLRFSDSAEWEMYKNANLLEFFAGGSGFEATEPLIKADSDARALNKILEEAFDGTMTDIFIGRRQQR